MKDISIFNILYFYIEECMENRGWGHSLRINAHAGQITTASAIAWMVKYLDENHEVQERLRVS